MLPKVNSWRDAGDTPGRKKHQEEAKLQHVYIASPTTLNRETRMAPMPQDASSYPAWETTRTTTQTPTPGRDAEGLAPNPLRLKLHCI
jgi:hypothetical protein